MKYWKRIQLEHVETIQSKTLKFLQDNQSKLKSTYSPLNFADYINAVPELHTAFVKYNVKPIAVAVYIMRNNSDIAPHKDSTQSNARVNIPILNCDDTWTVFYQAAPNIKPASLVLPNGVVYMGYHNEDIEEVDRVCISEPTIIRPQEIHSVIMQEKNSPRITLTVTCSPDPEFILEQL